MRSMKSASAQWLLVFTAGVVSLYAGKRYSKNQADQMYKDHYNSATSRDDISAAIASHSSAANKN
jgi:hypothetical protein